MAAPVLAECVWRERGLKLRIMTILRLIMATADWAPTGCQAQDPHNSPAKQEAGKWQSGLESTGFGDKLGFKFASASYHLCDLGQER